MGHIFLSFLFFNFILIIVYRHYKKGEYYIKNRNLFFYTILFIAYGVYGGGEGDYLTYKKSIENYFQTLIDVEYYDSFEIQYNYLAYLVKGNYELWRLVIYSVQFIGMSWLLYKAKLNTYPVLICFTSTCLIVSIYGRAFWGLIYFTLGVFLLIRKRNPLYLIAIALCYVSHTQNIVLLVLLPLAFLDLKKWQMLVVIVSWGGLVTLFQDTFSDFLNSGGIEGADHLNNKLQIYGEKGTLKAFGNSIGEVSLFVLRYVPAAMIFLHLIYMLFNSREKYLRFDKPYRSIMNISIGIFLVSLIVLVAGMGSGALFYRIIAMVFFPLSLFLPYLKESRIIKKSTFNNLIVLYIIYSELRYVKDLYYAYVGGI